MSVLDLLAVSLKRRDEVPNQELAQKLVQSRDTAGIQELVDNLNNKNWDISSDCIKVLYEVGYLEPGLISGHVEAFLKQLHSRNNRMVWGAMLALAVIADLQPDAIFARLAEVQRAVQNGSVITIDNGVAVLARVAAARVEYSQVIFPDLLKHLKLCRDKEVGQHSEKILTAVNGANKAAFIEVLERRLGDLSPAQAGRVKKVIKRAQDRS